MLNEKNALTKIQATIIALIIIIAFALGTAYYYGVFTPEPPAEEEIVCVCGWTSDIVTWDPAVGWSTDSTNLVRSCYDRLISLKGSTLDLEPSLALDWDISADGLEYTFHLREDIKFADGSPFNATAVKVSIDRLIGVGQQSQNFISVKEVTVVDTYTVKFVLDYPFAPFLAALGTYQASIINPNALERHKTVDDPWAMEWFQDHTNGTGAYMFNEWKIGDSWSMVKNPGYWRGWEGPHIDKVVFLIVLEPATRRMMLENGDLDLSIGISPADLEDMRFNPYIRAMRYAALATHYFCFNNKKPPMDDVHVRRAISYAFDYEAALAIASYWGTQARGSMPKAIGLGWSEDTFQYHRNLTKAREELAKSAYPNGGFTLTHMTTGAMLQTRMGELLQANLLDLNINLELENPPWAILVDTCTNPDTARHMAGLLEFVSAPDPHFTMYRRFHSSMQPPGGGYNWAYYENPQVDALLEEALTEQDPEKRDDLYHQVDEILVEDAVMLFNYEQERYEAMGSWVHGYYANPALVQTFPYYDMWVRSDEKP